MPVATVADPLAALLDDNRGVAALEVALLLPVLAAILLGAADVAITAARARQVESLAGLAARSAQALGRDRLPERPSASGLVNGPELALPALDDLVALPDDVAGTVAFFRGCPTPAGVVRSDEMICPGGVPASAFAEIRMRAPVDRLVPWPENWLAGEVHARALVRLD